MSLKIKNKIRFKYAMAFFIGIASLLSYQGLCFAVEFNPFSLEPGLVGRNISSSPAFSTISSNTEAQPKPADAPTISPEAKKISFVLNKIIIKGNTAISTEVLQAIFSPYIHRSITVAKLQMLVEEATEKYQKEGYFLSKALLPPQEIKNGVVQVSIVEGFISSFEVQGLKSEKLSRFIEKYGVAIKANKPIKLAVLERYLLLINDIPGFKVKSVLSPDPIVPRGAKLTLVTEYKFINATLTQDNFQTRYLGPDETTLFTSLNSVFIPGGTLYARALNSNPPKKLQFYELRHDQYIGTQGLLFSIDGFVTKTNPQFILTPLDILGNSEDVNGTISYPLIRSRERTLQLFSQLDFMENSSTAFGEQLYLDRIRDASIGIQYNDIIWKGEDSINLLVDQGFTSGDALGFRSRFGAGGSFTKLNTTVSRNQILNERFSIFALVTAQYSNAILPAAETFIFGGPYLGRGYDWAQFIGDSGVAGKAEFRVNTAPDLPLLKQVQYYAFYDAGRLWSLLPGVEDVSGASAGLGFRAALFDHINAEAFVGKPLTTPNATQVILGKNGKAFLGYFQITAYL